MKKTKKLEELNQIDGKIHDEDSVSKPTRLDQIIGRGVSSKYGTLDFDEYTNTLQKMNVAELRSHATQKAGIIPSEDRQRCIRQLQKRFKDYTAAYKRPADDSKQPDEMPKKTLDSVLKILSAVK